MLEKESYINKIEIILPVGNIQIRRVNIIKENDKEIARTNYRDVYKPGDDIAGADATVRAVANAVWNQGGANT